MAKFSRRTVLLLLFAIVLSSLALRYPLVEHERHPDTYFAHDLAGSIQQNNRALWTFSPLSYFGYYPVSYPSGTSFLLAEFSDLTGIGIELTILLEGLLFGILFVLVVFCLSRQFNLQSEYSLLAAFLASVAPRFVDTSYWNGSARTPFVVFAALLVLMAFKAGSTRQIRMYLFVPVLLVGCFAVHHMAVLILLFGLAYLLSTIIANGNARVSSMSMMRRRKRLTASILLLLSGVAVILVSVFFLDYFEREVVAGFEKTSLFSFEPVLLSAILNLAASYTNQIGFILVVAILGIPVILRKWRISAETLFLITVLFVFIPLVANAQYISMLLAPFVAILGTAWIKLAIAGRRRFVAIVGVLVLISASVVLPVWSIQRWDRVEGLSGDTVVVDNQFFNDGAYLIQYNSEARAISNVDLTGGRLSAVSGVVFLWSGVASALSGDATSDSIKENLTWARQDFPKNIYLWFDFEGGPKIYVLVIAFFLSGADFPAGQGDNMPSGEGYYESHSRILVVVDNWWPSDFVWVWGVLDARLPSQLKNAEWRQISSGITYPLASYLTYESGRISVFALEVPS